MNENIGDEKKSDGSIQDYLSLGYLYLLVLGITKEAFYYGFLDINILTYSSILDVLLSPLAFLAEKPFVLLGFIILPFFLYYFFEKKERKKNSDLVVKKGELNLAALRGTLTILALGAFGFFVGTGIGGGWKSAGLIKKGEIKLTHQITFTDDKTSNVKLMGSNSQYLFYVLEKERRVTISPIQGNVKTINKLKIEK